MGWREDLHASYASTLDEYLGKLQRWGIGAGGALAARTGAAGTRRGGAAYTRGALQEGFKQQAASNLAAKLAAAEAGESARITREMEESERARSGAAWGLLGKVVGTGVGVVGMATGQPWLAGVGAGISQLGAGYARGRGAEIGAEGGAPAEMMKVMEFRKWLDEYLGGGATPGAGYEVPTPRTEGEFPGHSWFEPPGSTWR